jgi:hypothetical protein
VIIVGQSEQFAQARLRAFDDFVKRFRAVADFKYGHADAGQAPSRCVSSSTGTGKTAGPALKL